MKQLLIISLLALTACKSNSDKPANDSNKLPLSLISNPHSANGVDPVAAANKPTLDFKDTLHDFGTIHEGEVVTYDFEYTNNGKSPLLISGAVGSCGCTVPDFPHEPIAPGKSVKMKVTFSSEGKSGHQEKSVSVRANTLRGEHMLYIKAEVTAKK